MGEAEAKLRLDQFLVKKGVPLSRSKIQTFIKEGHCLIDGTTNTKPRYSLRQGESVCFTQPEEEVSSLPQPESIPLSILFEDSDLIVVDKPSGMVVHPGSGNDSGTLVNALLHHCEGQLSQLADPDRPGIVHRLDKDTSGCIVAAKSDRAYLSLVEQFSTRRTNKFYVAVVAGTPTEQSGIIKTNIGRHPVNRQKMANVTPPAGKEAITRFEVLRSDPKGNWSWVKCKIETGRTHQIRVHMKESLQCPILADPIYANVKRQKPKLPRLMLHARELQFNHPDDDRLLKFEAAIPEEFAPFAPE